MERHQRRAQADRLQRHKSLLEIALSFLAGARAAPALVGTVLGMLPPALIGALAPQIGDDLALDERGIGLVVAGFFAVSSLGSTAAGGLVAIHGWRKALTAVGLLAGLGALFVVLSQGRIGWIVIGLICGALANALAHPAASESIVLVVAAERRGISFAVKQAAVPGASLLAGASLPLFAGVDWTYSFLAIVMLGVLLMALCIGVRSRETFQPSSEPRGRPPRTVERSSLRVLCIAAAMAAGGSTATASFFVLFAVETGESIAVAGMLLAGGAASSICTRLVVGRAADRRTGGHLKVVSYMMTVGALGMVVLANASGVPFLCVGLALATGIGWGWNGLFHHGTMRLYSANAAEVAGVLHMWIFAGGILGPTAFGFVAAQLGISFGWYVSAALLAVSAVLLQRFRALYAGRNVPPDW